MKYSLNWIQKMVDIHEKDTKIFYETITNNIAELEEVHDEKEQYKQVFTGEIVSIASHPDATRMQVTQTKVGDTVYQIVCGAKNIYEGQKVPVALPGAVLPGNFVIAEVKKRGVLSQGMICSEQELGISSSPQEGIMELPKNTPLGIPFAEYLGKTDTILEIENTTLTVRPDMFSHKGLARELSTAGLASFKKEYLDSFQKEIFSQNASEFPFTFSIEKDTASAVYGIILETNTQKETPLFIKEALLSCGIRPIHLFVDITNYVMLELGIPLHAFDAEKISGKSIQLRKSKKGETVITLDSQKRELPENTIIMEDSQKIFDLCGIMGGENSEITPETTKIWLHAPVYNPILIRRASLALKHRTDASLLYEKKVPDCMAKEGLYRAITLLQDRDPSLKISSQIFSYVENKEEERKIFLSQKKLDTIVGYPVLQKEVSRILESLEFQIETKEDGFLCTVPPFRYRDINIEEDIIEEVVRFIGLQTIPFKTPRGDLTLSQISSQFSSEKYIKDHLSFYGYETLHLSFFGEMQSKKSGISFENTLKILHPLSSEQAYMRKSLFPALFETLEKNKLKKPRFGLFECGKVFSCFEGETKEENRCAFVGYNFTLDDITEVLTSLMRKIRKKIQMKETNEISPYAKKESYAKIYFRGKEIGEIGKMNTETAENYSLKKPVYFFDFSLEDFSLSEKPKEFLPFSPLPSSFRDQNITLEKTVLESDFLAKIQKNVPYLVSVKIIDRYTGKGVEETKKRLTVSAEYQSPEKTLTEEEIVLAHEVLVKNMEICI